MTDLDWIFRRYPADLSATLSPADEGKILYPKPYILYGITDDGQVQKPKSTLLVFENK